MQKTICPKFEVGDTVRFQRYDCLTVESVSVVYNLRGIAGVVREDELRPYIKPIYSQSLRFDRKGGKHEK